MSACNSKDLNALPLSKNDKAISLIDQQVAMFACSWAAMTGWMSIFSFIAMSREGCIAGLGRIAG